MFKVKNESALYHSDAVLIIGLKDIPKKFTGTLEQLDEDLNNHLTDLIKEGDISAKEKRLSLVHTLGKIATKRLLFVGLGKEQAWSFEKAKETFGSVFKKLDAQSFTSVSIMLETFVTDKVSTEDVCHAIGEALPMATYAFNHYKRRPNQPEKHIEEVIVYASDETELITKTLAYGFTYGIATNSARTLVNLPGNMLTATDLATYAEELAAKHEMEVEILNKEEMIQLGMGAILAVNQGSTEPPKMIVLKYQGKEQWTDVIGLVGKGVTFDTGGYSIKTKAGIVGMKEDMGGAAAVLGAMEIIAKIKPKQNVVAVIGSTDNMISGSAFKPDDVITTMSGKTVEVLNTDAEGRLVLADAMTYAKHHGANYLVDVATLTGGVITALGFDKTGALTNNESLFEQLLEASAETGEFIWQLPLTEHDRNRVRGSKIADLNNSPGADGHAIMGGAFIGEFAEGTPWIHLDIAGTASTKREHSLGPSGGTGVMVRTLANFIEHFQPINK